MGKVIQFRKIDWVKLISDRKFIFIIAALIGAIFFLLFYGHYILNTSHVDWLLCGGDLKTNFVGWEFFRHSQWTFPIGMVPELAHPFGIPITYMDSLPIMSIPFKLISSILPNNFQFFGLWGFLCYMLQGGFSAMIMRRWTKNILLILLGSMIFIISPVFLMRTFGHTALASQWIILAAIWATVEWRRINTKKFQIVCWSLLLCLAVLIHPYFVPMVGLFFAISVVLTHRDWLGTVAKIIVPVLAFVLVFWSIGGFSVTDISSGGLGIYALNLNSLFNPFTWSRFLQALPSNAVASTESLNYLGLGLILMTPVVLSLFFMYVRSFSGIKAILKKISRRHLLVAFFILVMCLLALSPQIQFGSNILLDIQLPHTITGLWSVFRATGRLFWPVYYLIITGIIIGFIYFSKKKMASALIVILLSIFVIVQFVDINYSSSGTIKHSISKYNKEGYASPFDFQKWGIFIGSKESMVILDKEFVPVSTIESLEAAVSLTDIALKFNLSMNTGYYARAPWKKILDYQTSQVNLLKEGSADMKTNLFITKDRGLASDIEARRIYRVNQLDGYYIIE